MVKIAIQGHPTRGNEVIKILESLGGKNKEGLNGSKEYWYFINSDGYIRNDYKSVLQYKGFKTYTLEEFKKEFPFKVGDIVQTKPCGEPAKVIRLYPNPACIIAYKVRYKSGKEMQYCPENIKFYKEMKEERNIKLTLEKAKEWYSKGGELKEIALQAFNESELNPLPRSWEEYTDKMALIRVSTDRLPLSSLPKKYIALYKLEQLRDCWRQGWEPTWDISEKWCIRLYRNQIHVGLCTDISRFLTFPTRKMAEEFLECFRDLIEIARDLI